MSNKKAHILSIEDRDRYQPELKKKQVISNRCPKVNDARDNLRQKTVQVDISH